jgi:hypothetical protein
MFWAWGLLGAFIYGINTLLLTTITANHSTRDRILACSLFFASLITGSVFAEAFTDPAQRFIARWISLDDSAVALTIGWASNYIWPKILRALGRKVDAFTPKDEA